MENRRFTEHVRVSHTWRFVCSRLRAREALMGRTSQLLKGETMTKILAAAMLLASFLLALPVIESGTAGSTQFFQAIGTADGGAGGD